MLCVQPVCVKDVSTRLQVNFLRVKLAQIKKKRSWGTLPCFVQINQTVASDQRQPTAVHYIVKCRVERFPFCLKGCEPDSLTNLYASA